MSLLMDALKKAELAKRQARGEPTTDAAAPEFGGLSLEPLPTPPREEEPAPMPRMADEPTAEFTAAEPPARTRSPFPPLPDHLESIEREFIGTARPAAAKNSLLGQTNGARPAVTAAPAPPPAPPPSPKPEAATATKKDQAAAENLFAAKKPAPAPRRGFMIGIGVLTVLAGAGIGGYFWWQLQPRNTALLPAASQTQQAAVKPVAMPPPPAAVPPTLTPAAATPAPAPTAGAKATPASDDEDEKPAPAARAERRAVAKAAAIDPDSPVRISKTPLRLNPLLASAYDAYTNGDLAAAQSQYERVLRSEPRNTDALHGLAAIAIRQGRTDVAEMNYQRVLEADPQDATAASALINLRGQGDGTQAESKLKSLIAANPDSAEAHFALGNLYAQRNRWSEAQQAYFRAYSAEPDNPDIVFNLAISLDHLRQNRLAAQYYQQALTAAKSRASAFDQVQAANRLRALQP